MAGEDNGSISLDDILGALGDSSPKKSTPIESAEESVPELDLFAALGIESVEAEPEAESVVPVPEEQEPVIEAPQAPPAPQDFSTPVAPQPPLEMTEGEAAAEDSSTPLAGARSAQNDEGEATPQPPLEMTEGEAAAEDSSTPLAGARSAQNDEGEAAAQPPLEMTEGEAPAQPEAQQQAAAEEQLQATPTRQQQAAPATQQHEGSRILAGIIGVLAAVCVIAAICVFAGINPFPDTPAEPPTMQSQTEPTTVTYTYVVEDADGVAHDVTETATFGEDGTLEQSELHVTTTSQEESEAILAQLQDEFGDLMTEGSAEPTEAVCVVELPDNDYDADYYTELLKGSMTELKVVS